MSDEAHPPQSPPAVTELPPTRPDVESRSTEFRPDERIGNYRLIRIIGGGMDLVWEAEQDQPRRIVALKLLKTGPGLPTRVEPDVLARLNHPNIAQVYEAGTVRVGAHEIPFFAMEYVAGARTITEYADQQKLTRRQRIELFIQVCDALHHGHQRGFLHCDLKPDNILVDSAGRVKVIDFGIAHAVGGAGDLGVSKGRPLTAQPLLGTPQYMSPEQLRLPTDELDRRTDVYALGLVLYELLCGKPPYHVIGATVGEITHTVCDVPPAPPSKSDRSLRGDLEAILLGSLAKSRDERYASAGELAAEQRRVLDYEPIHRRSNHLRYRVGMRVRRFVARHRIMSVIAAALLAFAVAGPFIAMAVYRLTPLNARFEGFMTSRLFAHYEFTDVRILAITNKTDLAAIAQAEGVPFEPQDKKSWRPIHGRLLQRLRNSGARVVAFDVQFTDDRPGDDEFVRGTQALKPAGIQVVVAMPNWQLDERGMPKKMSSKIAEVTRFGGVSGRFVVDGAWMAPLVYLQRGEAPVPSFSMVAAAAAQHPNADIEPHVDVADVTLDVYYARTDPETKRRATAAPAERIPFTVYDTETSDQPKFGLVKGARAAMFVLSVPSCRTFQAATIDYGEVFSASDAQLREWFAGKTIVIANTRKDSGDFHVHPDGRNLPGVYAHAAAIQMLLRGLPIRVTSLWIDFGAAVLGALLGAALAARRWPRWTLLIALSFLALVLSLVAYRSFHFIRNPLVGIVMMWIAAETAAWAGRARRRALLVQ